MGKISDALDKHGAEREQARIEVKTDSAIINKVSPRLKQAQKRTQKQHIIKSDLAGYEDILTRLHTQHPGESIKTIMFTGAAHGGGAIRNNE